VAVSGDHTALFDPGVTLAELGLGYGAVIRLVTGEEAMGILDVRTVEAIPDPAAAPAAPPAAVPALAVAALVPTAAAGSTNGHAPPPAPPEPVWRQPTWSPPSEPAPAYPPVASPPAFLPPPLPPGGAPWSEAPPEWEPYPPSIPADVDPTPPARAIADPSVGSHPEDAALPAKVGGGERFWRAVIPERSGVVKWLSRSESGTVGLWWAANRGWLAWERTRASDDPGSRWSARSGARTYDLDAGEERRILRSGSQSRRWFSSLVS